MELLINTYQGINITCTEIIKENGQIVKSLLKINYKQSSAEFEIPFNGLHNIKKFSRAQTLEITNHILSKEAQWVKTLTWADENKEALESPFAFTPQKPTRAQLKLRLDTEAIELYAIQHKISGTQAFDILNQSKALDYVEQAYNMLHTLNSSIMMEDINEIVRATYNA